MIKATQEDVEVGKWLSAALDDVKVCQDMKDDITKWMESKDWEIMCSKENSNQLEIKWEKTMERNENG